MIPAGTFSRRLGRFTFFNVGQQVWLAALSLVATPVLYHRLGEDAYGLLAVVNLVAAQLSILDFGFGHATVRRLSSQLPSGDRDELSRTLATSTWVFLGAALVGGTAILLGAGTLAERYFRIPDHLLSTGRTALRIGALFFAATVLGNLGSSVWQGVQRFGYLNLVGGTAATLQILGSIALVVSGYGVLHIVSWSTFLGLTALAVHLVWMRRTLPGLSPFGMPDARAFREMAGFGLMLMLAGVFVQLYFSGGALVMGHYVAVGMLPFFTVPLNLQQRLARMGYGLSAALYPLVAELDGMNDAPSIRRVFLSGTRILTLVAISAMAPAVLLATPFLGVWMGPDFAAGGGVVLELLFVSFAISVVTLAAVEVARGTGKAGLLVAFAGIPAVVNLVGVLVMVPSLGPVGAAVAFLVAQAVASGFALVSVGGAACLRLLDLKLLALVAAGVTATVAGLQAPPDPLIRLAMAVVLGAALSALSLAWVLHEEERVTLRRMVGRS